MKAGCKERQQAMEESKDLKPETRRAFMMDTMPKPEK